MSEKIPLLLALKNDESYDFHKSRQDVANERGVVIIYPKDDELFIDIDSGEQYKEFINAYQALKQISPCRIIKDTVSLSGLPHRHIIVQTSWKLTDIERLALQFTLCSDRVRESLGVFRVFKDIENPTCFFEKEK